MKTSVEKAQSIVGFQPEGRPENDFYPTPSSATKALLSVEKFQGPVWENACGNGAMSKVIEAHGYKVISTDIEPRGYGETLDFLLQTILLAPNIATNPPFKYLCEFILRAHELGAEKFAYLAKLTALEGGVRSEILERTKLTRVWVFRNRILMTRNGEEPRGSGMIAFAWYVWEKNYRGKPEIGWI